MFETYVEVDIDKIINNINNIRSIDSSSMYCAVVKANGYGLGAVDIAREIEGFVDYFAVARASEAIELRKSGITKPIMVLGFVSIDDVITCANYDIEIPVFDIGIARTINDKLNKKIKVHIALDTGHSRIGFRDFEIDKIRKLKKFKNLDIISAFTHFATADESDTSFTEYQYKIFNKIISQIKNDFNFEFIHLANSAATIKHHITRDMQRVGISTYGIYPSDLLKEEKSIKLDQCFKFKSQVSFIKEIDQGTPISYGRTFIADKKMKIATIPIGYADGYHRSFSNLGEVSINGNHCRVVGRVCMDQMMVDVTGLDVSFGDEVIIYPDIYKEALKIDTIAYELMTSIAMRVPRIYKKNGKIINIVNYLGEIDED